MIQFFRGLNLVLGYFAILGVQVGWAILEMDSLIPRRAGAETLQIFPPNGSAHFFNTYYLYNHVKNS